MCVCMYICMYVFVEDKPSNMELRQRCIVTMQKNEQAVEHSVSHSVIARITRALLLV